MGPSDQNRIQPNFQEKYISERWSDLSELERTWGKEAIKYLMLTNSGGAVATLGFIGTSTTFAEAVLPKLALVCFFIGIISAGVLIAYAFETMTSLFTHWRSDVRSFRAKKIEYDALVDGDEDRVPNGKVDRFFGYLGFGAFIVGAIVGATGLFLNI